MSSRGRCKVKLPSPEVAGYATKETLLKFVKEYPHLRPCPKLKTANGHWEWIYRSHCENSRCDWLINLRQD